MLCKLASESLIKKEKNKPFYILVQKERKKYIHVCIKCVMLRTDSEVKIMEKNCKTLLFEVSGPQISQVSSRHCLFPLLLSFCAQHLRVRLRSSADGVIRWTASFLHYCFHKFCLICIRELPVLSLPVAAYLALQQQLTFLLHRLVWWIETRGKGCRRPQNISREK